MKNKKPTTATEIKIEHDSEIAIEQARQQFIDNLSKLK
jgi:hypothetical protein